MRAAVTRRRPARLSASLVLVLCAAVGACSTDEPPKIEHTSVPTTAADRATSICGLAPDAITVVTGYVITSSQDDFTGEGPSLRGDCHAYNERSEESVVYLTVDDADSVHCVESRNIVDGRLNLPRGVPFERLDGGAWGRTEPSDVYQGEETSSTAFVGDACLLIGLLNVAPGQHPVPDLEALSMQAIATLGLDDGA